LGANGFEQLAQPSAFIVVKDVAVELLLGAHVLHVRSVHAHAPTILAMVSELRQPPSVNDG
jgi:hypothetical protein